MKPGWAAEGGGEPARNVVAGHIPRISNDEFLLSSFRLERFESKGDLVEGFVPGDLFPASLPFFPARFKGDGMRSGL